MRTLIIVITLTVFSNFLYAADISCRGQITYLMADHPSCTDSSGKKQLAFQMEGSGSWKCNNSDTASSMVLAAKMSNKSITVYLNDAGGATCQAHQQYIKPSYTIIP